MKVPKPRKVKKKYDQKEADRLFSLLIRHRGHCEAVGKDEIKCGGTLQCAHIIGRANKKLRFDSYNALCLCAGHHYWYTNHPHQWFWNLIPQHFPLQFEYVKRHQNELVRHNSGRLKEIVLALDAQLTALGVEH